MGPNEWEAQDERLPGRRVLEGLRRSGAVAEGVGGVSETWWKKCRDCGTQIDPAVTTKSRRTDVCDPCMENRYRLVEARGSGAISNDTFEVLQRKLQVGRGKAKAAIEEALA